MHHTYISSDILSTAKTSLDSRAGNGRLTFDDGLKGRSRDNRARSTTTPSMTRFGPMQKLTEKEEAVGSVAEGLLLFKAMLHCAVCL